MLLGDITALKLRKDFICDIVDNNKDINDIVDSFHASIMYAATNSLKLSKSRRGTFPCNQWYDAECKDAKAILHSLIQEIPDTKSRDAY